MTSQAWCAGWRRPPHVPTDLALIEIRQPSGFRLCRPCWLAWSADDQEDTP